MARMKHVIATQQPDGKEGAQRAHSTDDAFPQPVTSTAAVFEWLLTDGTCDVFAMFGPEVERLGKQCQGASVHLSLMNCLSMGWDSAVDIVETLEMLAPATRTRDLVTEEIRFQGAMNAFGKSKDTFYEFLDKLFPLSSDPNRKELENAFKGNPEDRDLLRKQHPSADVADCLRHFVSRTRAQYRDSWLAQQFEASHGRAPSVLQQRLTALFDSGDGAAGTLTQTRVESKEAGTPKRRRKSPTPPPQKRTRVDAPRRRDRDVPSLSAGCPKLDAGHQQQHSPHQPSRSTSTARHRHPVSPQHDVPCSIWARDRSMQPAHDVPCSIWGQDAPEQSPRAPLQYATTQRPSAPVMPPPSRSSRASASTPQKSPKHQNPAPSADHGTPHASDHHEERPRRAARGSGASKEPPAGSTPRARWFHKPSTPASASQHQELDDDDEWAELVEDLISPSPVSKKPVSKKTGAKRSSEAAAKEAATNHRPPPARATRHSTPPLSEEESNTGEVSRRPNRRWSEAETKALERAVTVYGPKWRLILDSDDCGSFSGRTQIDLKDKWRNLMKSAKK